MAAETETQPDAAEAGAYQDVIAAADIQPNSIKKVEVDGRKLLICRVNDNFYAIDIMCSHAEMPLINGRLRGDCIICPVHGARFQLSDGKHLSPPAWKGLKTYPVRVVDGRVQIVPVPREPPGGSGDVRSIAF